MFIAADMLFLESMVRNSTPLESQHFYVHVYLKSKDQGGRAQHDFSLAWLEAAWYSSRSGHGPTRNWRTEAGVLKKLSLAGLAKLSRLRYSCTLLYQNPIGPFQDHHLGLVWP